MHHKAFAHFRRVDQILTQVLQQIPDTSRLTPITSTDYFSDLVETIICQQLSDKAGATIFARVQGLFPKKRITAKHLLRIPDEKLRSVGPSRSKILFIKQLAKSVTEKVVDLEAISTMRDEEVVAALTKLKGIGPWTAEMFLMFSLGREDVFSYGDLGLRNAIKKLYGLKKDPTKKQMKTITRKWSPYRTYACRILWKSLDL